MVKVIVNLLCVVPPILLGGFSRCLSVIISFTGLMGFIIMLAPACILLKAQKYCEQFNSKSHFQTILSKK